jgi:hypothetical protein
MEKPGEEKDKKESQAAWLTFWATLAVLVAVIVAVSLPRVYSDHVNTTCLTPFPCADVAAHCTDVQGWFGTSVQCQCPGNAFGRSCNRCFIEETMAGLPSRRIINGRFVAMVGRGVSASSWAVFMLTLWTFLKHRYGSGRPEIGHKNEETIRKRRGSGAAAGALVKPHYLNHTPLAEPYIQWLLVLTGFYFFFWGFSHTPSRFNDQVRVFLRTLTHTTECHWYGGPIFLSLSFIVLGQLFASVSAYTVASLSNDFSKQDKAVVLTNYKHDKTRGRNWFASLANALGLSLVVLAFTRLFVSLDGDNRSCCHPLLTASNVDMGFYIVMLVVLGVTFLMNVYVCASAWQGLVSRDKQTLELLTKQFFAVSGDGWNFWFCVFSSLMAAGTAFMFGVIAADVNAFSQNNFSLTEPVLKFDILFILQIFCLTCRTAIFFNNQNLLYKSASYSVSEDTNSGALSESQQHELAPYLALESSGNPLFASEIKQVLCYIFRNTGRNKQDTEGHSTSGGSSARKRFARTTLRG